MCHKQLTNSSVAKYSGFENIYNTFKETDKYNGFNYNQLNTELLSNDLLKLGEIPKLLFNIIKLYSNLKNINTPIVDLLPGNNFYDDMEIRELKDLVNTLNQINGNTLGEYIKSMLAIYNKNDYKNERYKKLIDWTLGFEKITYELFSNYLIERLFNNKTDEDVEHASKIIRNLLEISINEYEYWYKFISEKQEGKIVYHTYHGTKGREFDNVIIIMENAFGLNKNYFNHFFENINLIDLEGKDKQKIEQVKNLLYVSCSRAIKNLRILYIDDVSSFDNEVEGIFGNIYQFEGD